MTEPSSDAPGQTDTIRDRITASQARKRGRSSPSQASGQAGATVRTPPDMRSVVEKTVEDHPLALLAGSLVMGIVAANLLQASLGRRIASGLLGVIATAGELGAAAGSKTLGAATEAGRAGQQQLTRLGDAVAEESAEVRRRAVQLSGEARRRALSLASEAAAEAREAREQALKHLGRVGGRS